MRSIPHDSIITPELRMLRMAAIAASSSERRTLGDLPDLRYHMQALKENLS